jgi:hypothetical protein
MYEVPQQQLSGGFSLPNATLASNMLFCLSNVFKATRIEDVTRSSSSSLKPTRTRRLVKWASVKSSFQPGRDGQDGHITTRCSSFARD